MADGVDHGLSLLPVAVALQNEGEGVAGGNARPVAQSFSAVALTNIGGWSVPLPWRIRT
jgi:hypothetical protein